MADIVEAVAIDDSAILGQPKHARTGVAGLRLRRKRADLRRAETHGQHSVGNFGVFVEAGGEADRIGKIEAEGAHSKARIVARRPRRRHQLQGRDRRLMRRLRRQAAKQRGGEIAEEHLDHSMSPAKSWPPSARIGGAATFATRATGSVP
jgi:hypothetical protein